MEFFSEWLSIRLNADPIFQMTNFVKAATTIVMRVYNRATYKSKDKEQYHI